MKVYVSDKDDKKKYIKTVEKGKNDSLKMTLADGRVFSNIQMSSENIDKINSVQEEQAKKGLDNYVTFKNNLTKSKILLASSGILGGSLTGGLIALGDVSNFSNPVVLAIAGGLVTAFGVIPAAVKVVRDKLKVDELDKIRYRDNHIDDLAQYRNYNNALSGLGSKTSKYFKSADDSAFSIINIDNYSKEDLETIMSNIELEESLGLTYVKNKR